MRTKAHEAQCARIGFLIDKRQIGFDMAIPAILPVAGQCMVTAPGFKRYIGQQRGQHSCKVGIKRGAMPPPFFTFVIALKEALNESILASSEHAR